MSRKRKDAPDQPSGDWKEDAQGSTEELKRRGQTQQEIVKALETEKKMAEKAKKQQV